MAISKSPAAGFMLMDVNGDLEIAIPHCYRNHKEIKDSKIL
jgi:hypothetical protein